MGWNDTLRLTILRGYLLLMGGLLIFWWPLSHWFYPDWYHTLLGFSAGTYPTALVRVIGTCGIVPVALALAVARDPLRNRDALITLMVFSLVMAATYLHLIDAGLFPHRELINVALCLFSALFMLICYPWRMLKAG